MRRLALTLAALGLAFTVTACDFEVGATTSTTLAFDLGTQDGSCDGTETREAEGSTTTWTKTIEGDDCRIDFIWDGALMDMAEIREKVDAELEANDAGVGSAGVRIDRIELAMDAIRMAGGDGADITPPSVPSWAADVDVVEEPLLSIEGEDALSLPETGETFALSSAALLAASQAFRSSSPVPASAAGHLVIPLDDLAALGSAGETALELEMTVEVTGTASVTVF